MNPIVAFGVQVVLTVALCFLLVLYLRPSLYRILIDLCGNEPRAQFWLALSTLLLLGLPLTISLGYHPYATSGDDLFFELTSRLGGNIGSFLATVAGIGLVVSFFALAAPRPRKE